jgi:hypothetical protein
LHKGYDFIRKTEPGNDNADLLGDQVAINQKIISTDNEISNAH